MSETSLITGMGAALVDLFADVSEAQLADLGSTKAAMELIEADRSAAMQASVNVHTHQPGGSAALIETAGLRMAPADALPDGPEEDATTQDK